MTETAAVTKPRKPVGRPKSTQPAEPKKAPPLQPVDDTHLPSQEFGDRPMVVEA